MSKRLRVISVNFPFQNQQVVQEETLATNRALFDFDVVVIRPPSFGFELGRYDLYLRLAVMMKSKRSEIDRLLAQGGVLVIFLDAPYTYFVPSG